MAKRTIRRNRNASAPKPEFWIVVVQGTTRFLSEPLDIRYTTDPYKAHRFPSLRKAAYAAEVMNDFGAGRGYNMAKPTTEKLLALEGKAVVTSRELRKALAR